MSAAHQQDFRVPFAGRLIDGAMLSVEDIKRIKEQDCESSGGVLPVRGGRVDGCVCVDCGEPLVAKLNSTHYRDHFSHLPGSNCGSSGMTSIHLMAQQILASNKSLWLPHLYARHRGYRIKYNSGKLGKVFRFERSKLEYRVEIESAIESGDFKVADVALFIGDSRLLVEICVTNPCSDLKIQQYRNNKEPSVEIDISQLPRDISKESLTLALMNKIKANKVRSRWLFHRAYENKARWPDAIKIDQYKDWVGIADELTAHVLNDKYDEEVRRKIVQAEEEAYAENQFRKKRAFIKDAEDHLSKAKYELRTVASYHKRASMCAVDSREPEVRREQAKLEAAKYEESKSHWATEVERWQEVVERKLRVWQEKYGVA